MKNSMFKLISALLALCMLITVFAACNDNSAVFDASDGKQSTTESDTIESGTTDPNTTVPNTPNSPYAEAISYKFNSNGDGTCSLTNIFVNDESLTNIELNLPKKSPFGDIVTEIAFQAATTYGNVPSMMLVEDFDKLINTCREKAGDDAEKNFYINMFNSYYVLTPPDNASDMMTQVIQKMYPVTKITSIYVLNQTIDSNEIEKLSKIIYDFGYTREQCDSDFQNLINTVKQSPNCTAEILASIKGYSLLKNDIISVTIPNGVKSIGELSFANWDKVERISISESVENIGANAFDGCINIIQKEDGVLYVDKWAIGGDTDIENIVFKDNTVGIAESAFRNCESLENLTITNNVKNIGNSAFRDCTSLIQINFNATEMNDLLRQNNIFNKAGQQGSGITFNIGANVTKIPEYLFNSEDNEGTAKLTSIVFSENSQCEIIGGWAFFRCTELKSIIIPDGVETIDSGAFQGCTGITSINLSKTVIRIVGNAFINCTNLESINVNPDNTVFKSVSNCLVDIRAKYLFLGCKNSVIPTDGSVTSISSYAFHSCNGLKSITIPDSVESIGESAFYKCSNLESIEVSSGNTVYKSDGNCLIEISSKTLILGCKNSVIPTDGSVTSIGNEAFAGCSSLKSIVIPSTVTSIGNTAFMNCTNLESIMIPISVESVGGSVFYGCTNLTVYAEAESQPSGWNIKWNYTSCPVQWGYTG